MYFKEYKVHLEQDAVWMGSAMMIDEPKSLGKTLGSAQVINVPITSPDIATNVPILANLVKDISSKQAVGDVSPKERKLIHGLQKTIIKYIEHHCKVGHPTTDLLHEHINAALEGALLGMDMDNIIIPRARSKGDENHKAHAKRKM
ncbi:hypothetical protein BDR06DRAFT_968186 [Suillus hirtellus]|nr:hypothetical protein BDR06DRAFT_968186 [Suillus hirtellus]